MAGVKISQLQDGGALQPTDAFPVARGSFTRKIAGSELLTPIQSLNARTNELSSNVTSLSANVTSLAANVASLSANVTSLSANVTSSLNALSASTVTMLVPTGAILTFPAAIAPTGWLALSGQLVSRTTYSNLWAFAQSSGNLVTNVQWTSLSAYGSFSDGDGSTTFRIPDLRGYFVRGSGTHTDGTATGNFGQAQAAYAGSNTFSFFRDDGDSQTGSRGSPTQIAINGEYIMYTNSANSTTYTKTINTIPGDTRPKNIALLYCIKT